MYGRASLDGPESEYDAAGLPTHRPACVWARVYMRVICVFYIAIINDVVEHRFALPGRDCLKVLSIVAKRAMTSSKE